MDIADRWKFTSLYPNIPHDAYFVWFYSVLFIIDNFWPTTRKIKSQKFWTSIAFFGTLKNKLLRATRSTPLNLKRNLLIYIHKKTTMIYTAPMKMSLLKYFRVFCFNFSLSLPVCLSVYLSPSLSLSLCPVSKWSYKNVHNYKPMEFIPLFNLKVLRIFFHCLFFITVRDWIVFLANVRKVFPFALFLSTSFFFTISLPWLLFSCTCANSNNWHLLLKIPISLHQIIPTLI